jgi:hypothetical protein
VKKSYSHFVFKKEEKYATLVDWETFPLVPLETIIVQQSIFLASSILFILSHHKEKMLNDISSPH